MGKRPFLVYWLPVLSYAALTLVASSIPPSRLEPLPMDGWDKVAHAIEYAIFGWLLARALARAGPGGGSLSLRRAILLALLIAAGWGVLDELYQSFTGRTTDPFDWLADSAGAALSLSLVALRVLRGVEPT